MPEVREEAVEAGAKALCPLPGQEAETRTGVELVLDALLPFVVFRSELEQVGWRRIWPDGSVSFMEHRRDNECEAVYRIREAREEEQ